MARKRKSVNKTNIPEHEIEKIARCLLPDIRAFYNSEEGQMEFEEWKATYHKSKDDVNKRYTASKATAEPLVRPWH